MFLITWIEGEEVNYKLVNLKELYQFRSKDHVIMQKIS